MIVVECLYTSNEIEEETILREQQKRCLAAAASYGWAVRREVFEPLQLSARGMDDRTGIQTILDDVCNRRFDLLMIASMDRLSYDKGYKVTVHLRMSYAQFLGIEGNGEIQVRKDVCA